MKKYKKHKKRLNRYIKENLSKGYSLESIEKTFIIYGYDPIFARNLVNNYKSKNLLIKNIPSFLILIALISIFFFIKPATAGYIVASKTLNFTDRVNLMINRSGEYVWNLENNGTLKSVRLNGKVKANGFVRIYMEHGNNTYLVFDNKKTENMGFGKVTGYTVNEEKEQEKKEKDKDKPEKEPMNETSANETDMPNETLPVNQTIEENTTQENATNENKTISITIPLNESIIIYMQYNKNTPYDEDDNGIEPINGVIDFTVADSYFGWNYNASNLCTRWEVYSIDSVESTTACYGSNMCCNFIGLLPERENWNETFYLAYNKYGATFNNIVSAQVLDVNYNLSVSNPFVEIYYSRWKNLTANFYEEFIDFEKACVETCILPDLNATSYTFRLEIENSSLILDSISYEITSNETFGNQTINHAPALSKNLSNISIFSGQKYAINLSEHFYDEDNDTLVFDFYNNSLIDVEIINETATLSPFGNFTGTTYMFFTANDSIETAVSNVFSIEVKERESRSLKSLRRIIGLK